MDTTTVDCRTRAYRTIPDSRLLEGRATGVVGGDLRLAAGELLVHKTYSLGLGRKILEAATLEDALSQLVVAWRGRRGVPAAEIVYREKMTGFLYVLVSYGPDVEIAVHPELPRLVDLPAWLMDAVTAAPDQEA